MTHNNTFFLLGNENNKSATVPAGRVANNDSPSNLLQSLWRFGKNASEEHSAATVSLLVENTDKIAYQCFASIIH